MEDRPVICDCLQLIKIKILYGCYSHVVFLHYKSFAGVKECNILFFLLIALTRSLFLAFFGELLLKTTLTVAVQLRLTPVFTQVFGNKIFVSIILRHYHHLVKGL